MSDHARACDEAEAGLVPDFRRAMRGLAAPVTLITVRDAAGGWHGMAASSVSSLCVEPPSVLVALNRNSATLEVLRRTGRFCVNCLSGSQQEIVEVFAQEARRAERFSVGEWREGPNGAPAVEGCLAALFCEVDRAVDYGTHTVFMNRVEAVRLSPSAPPDPLLWLDGGPARAAREGP